MKYKYLEHTADIKFQAFGKSIEEIFKNSALAMFNSMFDKKVNKKIKKRIKVKGNNNERLLYNFLEELLFLFDSEGFFVSEIKELKINKNELTATLFGDKAENYQIYLDVKAVTYNEMFVKFDNKKDKWIAQVVLDV